jgi:hypothetical protein
MTLTRNKLSEAEYFLNCMKCYEAKPEVFKYNLSAFLCAFRTILDIIQKEFLRDQRAKGKEPQFQKWWETQEVLLSQDAKIVLLCNVRDENIHERPLQLVQYLELSDVARLRLIEGGHLGITYKDGSTQRIDTPSSLSEDAAGSEPNTLPSYATPPLCFNVTPEVRKRIKNWVRDKKVLKSRGIDTKKLLSALFKDINASLGTPAINTCQDSLSILDMIISDCEQRFPM